MNTTAIKFCIGASLITVLGLQAWAADPTLTWSIGPEKHASPGALAANCTVAAPPGVKLFSCLRTPKPLATGPSTRHNSGQWRILPCRGPSPPGEISV